MKTPPAIPGFTFTKESYEDLVTRYLSIPGWQSQLLGQSVLGRPIYGFSLGDLNRPTMYVQGNIHGYHEWRTSWWVSEFMRLLTDPAELPPDTRDALIALKAKYSFYFIPSVNPDGYGTATANGAYGNSSSPRVSVSENFDFNWAGGIHTPPSDEYRGPSPWSEPESRIVRDKILEIKPVSVLCNHTWGSSTVGYTTRHPQNTAHDASITTFFQTINATLGYGEDVRQEFSGKLPTGSAYNWAGTQTSSLGAPIIGQVWESGGGQTVENQSRVGMTGILYHLLMVDDMLKGSEPEPEPEPEPGPPKPITFPSSWGPIYMAGQSCTVASVELSTAGQLTRVWPLV